jgi:hypothetical protein
MTTRGERERSAGSRRALKKGRLFFRTLLDE